MAQTASATTWIQTFQEFVHYSLGPLQPTPAVTVGSLVAVLVGLALAFRSRKLLRPMVTIAGVIVGTWAGIRLASFVGTPAPITAAVGAVALAGVAFKTHRLWLVAGSVLTLFFIATTYELGKGDLSRYIPVQTAKHIEQGTLPTADEQKGNLHGNAWTHLERVGERISAELRNLGPQGWLLPTLAAVVGAVLAWKALNIFAIVWTALLGAVTAVLGGITFICSHWPDSRTPIMARPDVLAGVMIGMWILGLIYQAKEARLPRAKPSAPKPDAPKS